MFEPCHGEDILEKGLMRNEKVFSGVFERIFQKYDREFERDEVGGEVIDLTNLSHEDFDLVFEKDTGSNLRRPTIDLADSDEEDELDPELAALLHEKVVQVKKEINWDEEELKHQQKKRKIPPSNSGYESGYNLAEEDSRSGCESASLNHLELRQSTDSRESRKTSEPQADPDPTLPLVDPHPVSGHTVVFTSCNQPSTCACTCDLNCPGAFVQQCMYCYIPPLPCPMQYFYPDSQCYGNYEPQSVGLTASDTPLVQNI